MNHIFYYDVKNNCEMWHEVASTVDALSEEYKEEFESHYWYGDFYRNFAGTTFFVRGNLRLDEFRSHAKVRAEL